jgi:hypothetical protein
MKRTSSAAAILLLASLSDATPWHNLGPRAMGMGGAQVAVAQGPLAAYWNPAGLGQLYNPSGVAIPAGIRAEFTGSVLEGAKDLLEINARCQALAGPSGGICNQASINNALDKFGQPGNGAMLDTGAGLEVKVKRVVVFTHALGLIGIRPRVSRVNITPTIGAGSIQENDSRIVLHGGVFTEIGAGYAHEILETGLVLGGNLKGVVGKVGYADQRVVKEDAGFSDFGNARTSVQPAVDLGLLWDMRETWPDLPMRPRFGVVGRNINNPRFKNPSRALDAGYGSRYSLHGQARAGFAFSPFDFWNLAADVDLTDNLTPVSGMRSRYLSAGTEVNVFNRTWINIPLRIGLQKNISPRSGSAPSYTAGFGLHFLHVMLDAAGMLSTKRVAIESEARSQAIPTNFGGSAQFAVLFGGQDEAVRSKKKTK